MLILTNKWCKHSNEDSESTFEVESENSFIRSSTVEQNYIENNDHTKNFRLHYITESSFRQTESNE